MKADPSAGHVKVCADGSMRTILIDRPDKANALTLASLETISRTLSGAGTDPTVRLVALRGCGTRVFCAGADLAEAREQTASSEAARTYDGIWDRVAAQIEQLPCASIAVINGACLGGGLSLVLACDLRIAQEDAYFSYPVAKHGFMASPDDVARLVSLAGSSVAYRLLVLGARISATEARAVGLVDLVLPSSGIDAALSAMRQQIEQGNALSQTITKRLIRDRTRSETLISSCYSAIYDGDARSIEFVRNGAVAR